LTPSEELALPERLKSLYLNERNLRIYERLLALKDEHQCSLYALSLAWFAGHPFQAIPVSSVRNLRQLEALIRAGEIVVPYEAMMQ
jgi:aryl-alcohol dehydrogenase-like predicted oxidoreductase